MVSLLTASSWPLALVAFFVVLGAAVVRGYAGFGFSALCVASLSFVMPMSALVPIILMLEVSASLLLLPGIWRDVRWRFVLGLTLSSALAAPLGIAALHVLQPDVVRTVVLLIIVLACVLLIRGFQLTGRQPLWRIALVGFTAGAFNAAGAVGGLIYGTFLLADGMPARAFRASLAMIFLLVDLVSVIMMSRVGLVDHSHALWLLLLLLPLGIGLAVGSRLFGLSSPEGFKRLVLSLLLFLAISGIVIAIVR